MADISVRSVTKVYPNGHEAVRAVDLDVADGEFLVLVGPSGCGKSTLLRLVAGLEEVTRGEVHIAGKDVTHAPPGGRDLAMVFQSYALYPHMTVRRNIGYPLKVAKVAKDEIDRRVRETAALLELDEVLDRRPAQLSGGQRQRVAMGRAIVRQPSAFLMDEPLSNLDAQLRVQMRAEIARLQRRLGTTTLYVTHDQVEAMTMGTRVAVLKDGTIQQADAPQHLYDRPANLFVATFIGSPRMNLFSGRGAVDDDGNVAVMLGAQRLALGEAAQARYPDAGSWAGREMTVGIRPEAMSDGPAEAEHTLEGAVELIEALGAELHVHLRLTGTDEPFIARFPPRSTVRMGDTVKVAIEVGSLHLFDPASGASLRGDGSR